MVLLFGACCLHLLLMFNACRVQIDKGRFQQAAKMYALHLTRALPHLAQSFCSSAPYAKLLLFCTLRKAFALLHLTQSFCLLLLDTSRKAFVFCCWIYLAFWCRYKEVAEIAEADGV